MPPEDQLRENKAPEVHGHGDDDGPHLVVSDDLKDLPPSPLAAPGHAEASQSQAGLHGAKVARGCNADWNKMDGNDSCRRCHECGLNVYGTEALQACSSTQDPGISNPRWYRRFDGRYVQGDCLLARQWCNIGSVTAAFVVGTFAALFAWFNRQFLFPGAVTGRFIWPSDMALGFTVMVFWYGLGCVLLLRARNTLQRYLTVLVFMVSTAFSVITFIPITLIPIRPLFAQVVRFANALFPNPISPYWNILPLVCWALCGMWVVRDFNRVFANRPASEHTATTKYLVPTAIKVFLVPFVPVIGVLFMAPAFLFWYFLHPVMQVVVAACVLWHVLGCYLFSRTKKKAIRVAIFCLFSLPLVPLSLLGPLLVTVVEALGHR
jgi:hypothetical protein